MLPADWLGSPLCQVVAQLGNAMLSSGEKVGCDVEAGGKLIARIAISSSAMLAPHCL